MTLTFEPADKREAKYYSTPAAVYRLWDAAGCLLYIGSAYDPEHRCTFHHTKPWWPEVARRTEEWHESRGAAYQAEMDAIGVEASRYNVMGTPTYVTPDTPAIRRRQELASVRSKLMRQAEDLRRVTVGELQAAGASYVETEEAGALAMIEFMEPTGLFTASIKERRKRLAARRAAQLA